MGKILVTGSTGFLGRHLRRWLTNHRHLQITWVSSKDCDLVSSAAVNDLFTSLRPSHVIHLAAYSGGIGANREYPADFFHINASMVVNVFEACARVGVEKLIYTMGGCSYPANATSPIDESQMWGGYPQLESAGYSMAKKMGIVAAECYKKQCGLNTNILIPGNMYGEYDNFVSGVSHVIPGMVRRYFEAIQSGKKSITMWGDGQPLRDFVYASDVARLIPWFLANDVDGPVNISSGSGITIGALARLIKDLIGWNGEILWDPSMPNGQLKKVFDVTKLWNLGLSCDTKIEDGLRSTIEWFRTNYAAGTDGIRL